MKSAVLTRKEIKRKWDAYVLGVFEGEKDPLFRAGKLDKRTKAFLAHVFESKRFKAKEKEVFSLCLPGYERSCSILLAGLGKRDGFNLEKLRSVIGCVMAQAKKQKASSMLIEIDSFLRQGILLKDAARATLEAAKLSNYRFDKYKTKANGRIEIREMDIVCGSDDAKKDVKEGMRMGNLLSDAVNAARSLAMEPANVLTPMALAEKALEVARDAGVAAKVLNEDQIRKLGMGGLLGVAQGSQESPKFVIMEYFPSGNSKDPVVLVGKGITFDSGGISIKPSSGMDQMKYDMSGASAVMMTLWLAGKLKLPFPVVGLAPICENLPSRKPQRPGDVIKIMNGKTVEVANTDAEGRLILADALCYALRYKPRYLIDLATLTGACRSVLGEYGIGVMGNHVELLKKIKDSGEKSGERCWEFPFWDEYKEHMKSEVADIRNIGKGVAGATIGGKFLEEFVGGTPWVHLDIASTAWFDENHDYLGRGATGAGVRLLADFLRELSR